MSIVIRPSPAVFRRTMPLVVVFGAYKRFEADEVLSDSDVETITNVVASARRFHVPLAFSRSVEDVVDSPPGVWLPGCRPKICDRVFNHEQGSAFKNREFADMFAKMIRREICFVGSESDSCMNESFIEARLYDRSVRIIAAGDTLQFCSTGSQPVPQNERNLTKCDHHSKITYAAWENTMCVIERNY